MPINCFRLASEAAVAPLEAADIESNAFDPYDARGSRAVRKTPSLAQPSVQRPVRRPAPTRVSLLSRSLPEERHSVLTSVFGEPQQQVTCAHVFVTFALKGMPLPPLYAPQSLYNRYYVSAFLAQCWCLG